MSILAHVSQKSNTICIHILNIYLTLHIKYNYRKEILWHMKNFKPIKQEKAVISIRLDVDVLKTIDRLSNDIDISRNEFIVQCINFALDNFKE